MSLKKIKKITEEFYGVVKSNYSKEVEVFKNPTSSDFRALVKIGYNDNSRHKYDKKFRLRYFIDGNDDLYMWVGGLALHDDMINKIEDLNTEGLTAGLVESDTKVVFFDHSSNSLNRDASIKRSNERLKYLIKDIADWKYEWDFQKFFKLKDGVVVPLDGWVKYNEEYHPSLTYIEKRVSISNLKDLYKRSGVDWEAVVITPKVILNINDTHEDYVTTARGGNGEADIFVNPSPNELNKMFKQFDEVRGLVDDKGNVYLFRGDLFHEVAMKALTPRKWNYQIIISSYTKLWEVAGLSETTRDLDDTEFLLNFLNQNVRRLGATRDNIDIQYLDTSYIKKLKEKGFTD